MKHVVVEYITGDMVKTVNYYSLDGIHWTSTSTVASSTWGTATLGPLPREV